jgi:antitoxin component of MazEF toxin-antitoxin module
MSTNPYTVDPDVVMAMGRRVLEASMRAIPAIYRKCPAVPVAPSVWFNPAAFADAMQMVEFAFRYDQIMYCFELVDRGQFEARYDPLEQRTNFTYVSRDESAADTLLRSHERDSNIELATEADKAVVIQLAPRYTLAELLEASDYSQPQPAEEREWIDSPSVGGELI